MKNRSDSCSNPIIPLTAVSSGRSAVLSHIRAGKELLSQLCAMGLIPGTTVDMRRNDYKGPVIISVGGGRLMLGRGMAGKVAVSISS